MIFARWIQYVKYVVCTFQINLNPLNGQKMSIIADLGVASFYNMRCRVFKLPSIEQQDNRYQPHTSSCPVCPELTQTNNMKLNNNQRLWSSLPARRSPPPASTSSLLLLSLYALSFLSLVQFVLLWLSLIFQFVTVTCLDQSIPVTVLVIPIFLDFHLYFIYGSLGNGPRADDTVNWH